MYGEKAYTLIKDLSRSEDNLPPYNVSIYHSYLLFSVIIYCRKN